MAGPALRIAIAGANAERGWALDAHLPALRALPGFTIEAVSERTQDNAEQAAAAGQSFAELCAWIVEDASCRR